MRKVCKVCQFLEKSFSSVTHKDYNEKYIFRFTVPHPPLSDSWKILQNENFRDLYTSPKE
jgi:hypothetical protein